MSARVAASTSRSRIRLSPTRKVEMPTVASASRSAGEEIPLSPTTMRSARDSRRQPLAGGERRLEGLEIAVVDADQPRASAAARARARRSSCTSSSTSMPNAMRRLLELPRGAVVDRRHDDQDAVGAPGPRFGDLVGVVHEVLAQDRERGRGARGGEIFRPALERGRIGEHRQASRAAGLDRRAPAPADRNRRGSSPSRGSPS